MSNTESREIQRPGGTTIHYTAAGPADGPVLALVHGWGCDRHDFDAIIGHLPHDLRVLAIDLAEHGDSRSTRDVWTMEEFGHDVVAVLAAESVESCVVAGHSLGGAVAVETARLLPGTVTRVVTLDALHYLTLFPKQDERTAEAILRPFREDFAVAMRGMVEAGSPPGTDPALIEAYIAKMGAVRQPAGLHALQGLLHWDMDAALREVAQPVLVFAVRAIITQEAVERYRDRVRIEQVDLGSHHFHVESPEATAELLVTALSD
ncbi:alpha/beta fold hydrolase [Amycolatopsis umgeniensis]|uniref:Pimeloyl-ACP methyl ester carboxylesterase n=1 Tax=Amycolatopsis umgeniensis TaxID=336628 RepID=A0A841BG59_9PSEU|nr:alpha/beta hydrolase [Amycolatopsis umgeniensis]MBB5857552.1 pimeloyl-ACP methyl ester carboxylesterase [Amycolatopsis umgeniensis]